MALALERCREPVLEFELCTVCLPTPSGKILHYQYGTALHCPLSQRWTSSSDITRCLSRGVKSAWRDARITLVARALWKATEIGCHGATPMVTFFDSQRCKTQTRWTEILFFSGPCLYVEKTTTKTHNVRHHSST